MLSVYEIKWYNISVFMNTIYMKTLLNRSFIKQIKSFILIAFASVFYGMGIALFLHKTCFKEPLIKSPCRKKM